MKSPGASNSLAAVLAGLAFLAPALPAAKVLYTELVTVTSDSFSLAWKTDRPEACAVKFGPSGKTPDQEKPERAKSAFHFMTVSGLTPGEKYFYRLECAGYPAPRSRLSPGSFLTPTPPAGKLLFSFAIMSDLHVNEDVAGLIILPVSFLPALSPGFVWKYPVDNYWAFTARNAVELINTHPVEFTIVNGDLTAWFLQSEFETAKQILDRLEKPYYVLRGNHDRQGAEPRDWFKAVFNLEESAYVFEHKGFLFVYLDDTRLADGMGEISQSQFAWLEKTLAANKRKPAFIVSHRPDALGLPDITRETTSRMRAILNQNPQVVACIYGHGHKAQITFGQFAGKVLPQIMVPATKEYPSGFGVVKVYEQGFTYNFHRTECADCLEWSDVTRNEYFGMAPSTLFKKLSDRNMVFIFPEQISRMVRQ